jgi:serine/threonine-protein kinase
VPDQSEQLDRLKTALADRYRIERELGTGGMATVYLAHDLKHDRKIAIKVLKSELAAVLGAERFVQEIKTTANLQHPHILPLFDSGEASGFLYYVMPYIEGETLRDKLNRETQLGIDEAVKITTEVADALDYAHQQNVIHRDIKPENILLHDGRPMVADFGIALAVSAAAGGRMTETGLSLGTPHYMSPEQATAEKNLTNRSDIYSLGAVLYEMLAGDPPHIGGTAQQIIIKIVTEQAQPVTKVRKAVPPNVAAAVAVALEKLPADRFESAKAFAEALSNPGFRMSAAHGSTRVGDRSRPSWNRISMATAALAVLLFGTTVWGWIGRPPAPTPTVTRFTITPALGDGTAREFQAAAIAPDGSKLVYAVRDGDPDADGLYLRALDRFESVRIPGTEGGISPFFSPDGEWVGFWAEGALRKVPVNGGPVVAIVQKRAGGGASWGANDRIVFSEPLGGLHQVSSSGGVVDTLTRLDFAGNSDLAHAFPAVLPGAKAVLFTSVTNATGTRIAVASMDTGEWHVLLEVRGVLNPHLSSTAAGPVAATYVPTGHILFGQSDGSLWAVAFDLDALAIRGEPVLVMDQTVSWARVAENGTLLFGAAQPPPAGELTWVDRAGLGSTLRFPPQQYLHPRLSPDGRRVAVTVREASPPRETVWILDLERRTRTRFTEEGPVSRWPVWTHHGTRIAFVSSRNGASFDLFWKPVDGGGDARVLLASESRLFPLSWSEDHQALAYIAYETTSSQSDIWTLPPEGEGVSVVASPFDERAPAFSPDGRWLAYVSNESGQDQVYVRPYPGPGAPIPVSIGGGIEPAWSRAGDALYFRRQDRMMVVSVGVPGTFGSPRELFRQPYALSPIGRGHPNFDVAADGRFLMVRTVMAEHRPSPIHVVLNFFEQLRQRMAR